MTSKFDKRKRTDFHGTNELKEETSSSNKKNERMTPADGASADGAPSVLLNASMEAAPPKLN